VIAFDTNYLVRHLVKDDAKQSREVTRVFKREANEGRTILLLDIVMCETVWVLSSLYNAKKSDILKTLKALEDEVLFEFESEDEVSAAIDHYEKGKADFSDYLIDELGKSHGRELVTFDKRLMKG